MPGRTNFGLAIYSGNTFPAAQSILLLEPAQEQLALYLVLRGRTESTGCVSRSRTGSKCSVAGKCSNDGGPQAGIRYGRRPGNRVQAGHSKQLEASKHAVRFSALHSRQGSMLQLI